MKEDNLALPEDRDEVALRAALAQAELTRENNRLAYALTQAHSDQMVMYETFAQEVWTNDLQGGKFKLLMGETDEEREELDAFLGRNSIASNDSPYQPDLDRDAQWASDPDTPFPAAREPLVGSPSVAAPRKLRSTDPRPPSNSILKLVLRPTRPRA